MATITNPTHLRALTALAAGLILASAAHAQAYVPPPPPLTTAPCVPTRKDPCAVQQPVPPSVPAASDANPFPGDASQPAGAPTAPTPQNNQKPASADQNPFPGVPDTPADTPKAPPNSDNPGESSSSSSSSSSSPDDAPAEPDAKSALKDAGSTGSTRFERKHLAKVEDTDHRELEDLDVSHYYMTTGNFTAAYARAQDAVKLYPDDENAHIALAVSAEKLKKYPEAAAEYKIYLKLAPDGTKAKLAQRALETMPAR